MRGWTLASCTVLAGAASGHLSIAALYFPFIAYASNRKLKRPYYFTMYDPGFGIKLPDGTTHSVAWRDVISLQHGRLFRAMYGQLQITCLALTDEAVTEGGLTAERAYSGVIHESNSGIGSGPLKRRVEGSLTNESTFPLRIRSARKTGTAVEETFQQTDEDLGLLLRNTPDRIGEALKSGSGEISENLGDRIGNAIVVGIGDSFSHSRTTNEWFGVDCSDWLETRWEIQGIPVLLTGYSRRTRTRLMDEIIERAHLHRVDREFSLYVKRRPGPELGELNLAATPALMDRPFRECAPGEEKNE